MEHQPKSARLILHLVLGGLCLALISACQLIDIEVPANPKAASLSVDTATVVRTAIPGGLFGMNIEWIEKGNGMADANGNFGQTWIDAGKAAVDHVRWPGGIFSDYYHWTDGIGPVASRPARDHHTDSANEPDLIGTPGIARYAQAIGGKLLLTVNAGTGTAAEAADWVRYCNAASDGRRAADGFSAPLGVDTWEIGNELYLPENPGTPKVGQTAAQYAATFSSFAPAMRAAVPGYPIQLLAISEAFHGWVPMYEPGWLATLLAAAAPQIDLVAVHDAYAPVLISAADPGRGTKEVYQAMWAAPEAIAADWDRMSATIAAAEASQGLPAGKIGLALTEWGPLFGSDKRWVDNNKTLGSAVFVALIFQGMAVRDRLRMAEGFKFTDSFTQGWMGFDGVAKPIWEVFRMMAKQKGYQVVKSALSGSDTYDSTRVGAFEAAQKLPELTSLASLSADGKTLWLTLVNRSWLQPYDLSLNLGADWSSASATSYTLSGSVVTNHNGPDVQSWIPAIAYYNDPYREGPVPLVTKNLGASRSVTLPNHSVVFVELKR